jgi:hypothetical protein
MSKTYVLKHWDAVNDHHFINRKRWDELESKVLEVEFLDGFLSTSALIYPKGETPTIGNVFMVKKDDLIECVHKAPTKDTNKNCAPTNETLKEKTYTKDEIRKAGARVMADIESESEAISTAMAIGKLINELN